MLSSGCSAGSTLLCLRNWTGAYVTIFGCEVSFRTAVMVVASSDDSSFLAVQTGGRNYIARWLCLGN